MHKILTLLFGLLLLFTFPVMAQDDTGEGVDASDGVNLSFPDIDEFDDETHVRFAHLAPDAGNVDIYLNSELQAEGVTYGTLGEWMNLPGGGYNISIVPAGESMDSAVVNLDSFQLPRGQFTTAAVIWDQEDTPAIVTAVEDFSEPIPGTTNITFFNALSMENDVDFYRDGVPFVMNLGQLASDINSYSYAIPVDTDTYVFSGNTEMDNQVLAAEEEVDLMEAASYLIAVYGDTEGNAQLLVDETTRAEYAVLRGLIPEDGTVVDALRYIEELQPYARMLEFTELDSMLNEGGPYTLFIPAGFLADEILITAFDDAELLSQILQAHVYEGEALYSGDLIERDSLVMANGNEIPVVVTQEDDIAVGGADVLEVNIPATNGVIHVLGYVIDPSLDQEAYDLFDDAVNLIDGANAAVVGEMENMVDDMEEEDSD